jgi:hypothetical protein
VGCIHTSNNQNFSVFSSNKSWFSCKYSSWILRATILIPGWSIRTNEQIWASVKPIPSYFETDCRIGDDKRDVWLWSSWLWTLRLDHHLIRLPWVHTWIKNIDHIKMSILWNSWGYLFDIDTPFDVAIALMNYTQQNPIWCWHFYK